MRTMRVGEVQMVEVKAASNAGDSFVIDAADYKVVNLDIVGTINNGAATVTNDIVGTLFSATKKGNYTMEFTIHIGAQIFKPIVYITVD
jgi:hypothetical protein